MLEGSCATVGSIADNNFRVVVLENSEEACQIRIVSRLPGQGQNSLYPERLDVFSSRDEGQDMT